MDTVNSPVESLVALFQSAAEPALVLVGFDKPSQRDQWIDDLALALHDTQHIVVDLRHTQVETLGAVLQEKLPDTLTGKVAPSTAFVHLLNVEATLVEELQEGEARLLSRLEAEAADLPVTVAARCIWWADPYVYQHLEKEAPQLWRNIPHKFSPSKNAPAALPPSASPGEWLGLGRKLLEEGHYPEATIAFREAARGDASLQAAAEAGMGEVYQGIGLYKEALDHYNRALEEETLPETSKVCLQRGRCLFRMKEWDEALASFQQALEGFEAQEDAKALGDTLGEMGQVLLQQQKQKAALAHFYTAVEAYEEAGSFGPAADVLLLLAQLQERQGEPEGAIGLYQNAARGYQKAADHPATAKAWQHAATLLQNRSAWQEAKESFRAALTAARHTHDDFLIAALEDSLETLEEKHPNKKPPRKGFLGKLFGS